MPLLLTYALLRRQFFLFSSEFYKPAKGLAMVSPTLVLVTEIFLCIEKTQ